MNMSISIVIGPSWSGKKEFIAKYFPGYQVLSVGDYQRRLLDEKSEILTQSEYYQVLLTANEQIKNDFIKAIKEGKNVIMAHTLYKAKRRKEYLNAIRNVTNEPINIYVMQPSDTQILEYIQMDTERQGDLNFVKEELKQIEMPNTSEGFAHVYIVKEEGIYNEYQKIEDKTKGFGEKAFRHICEVCGKEAILTSKQAFDAGWDYPGEGAIYPTELFGVLSPRTCGNCGITETAYWAITVEKKTLEQLSEKQKQAVERILQEPDILNVDER